MIVLNYPEWRLAWGLLIYKHRPKYDRFVFFKFSGLESGGVDISGRKTFYLHEGLIGIPKRVFIGTSVMELWQRFQVRNCGDPFI